VAIEHRNLSPVSKPNRGDCIHRRNHSSTEPHLTTWNISRRGKRKSSRNTRKWSLLKNILLLLFCIIEHSPRHAGIAASRNRTSRDRCLSTPGNRDHRSQELIVTDAESRFRNDNGSRAARMFELRW